MSAQNTPATPVECQLNGTIDSIAALRMHMRVLTRRFAELDRGPGGREHMAPEQRVEYDLIGGVFADFRAAIAKANGGAA